MPYRAILGRSVQKELRTLDSRYKYRVLAALIVLSKNPLLGKKLKGEYAGQYSYRVWPYRILYVVDQKKKIIQVGHIAHRQGIYK